MSMVITKPLRLFAQKFGRSEHSHPMEGILRPAVELNTAFVAGCAAMPFLVVPQFFMISRIYGLLVGSVLAGFALRRLAQGLLVVQYKIMINKTPKFSLSIKQLSNLAKPKKIYVGEGFRWKNNHTQRLYDLETITSFSHYLKHKENDGVLGGKPHIHGVGSDAEMPIYTDFDDRIGHMLVYGQSRSGKSRFLDSNVEQDMATGEAICVIDPKGDPQSFKRFLLSARKTGRIKDVRILHLGFPDSSVRYNPIASYQKISEIAGRISSKLPSSGDSQAFASFAWRFVYIVTQALDLLKIDQTIAEIKKHILNLDSLLFLYAAHFLQKNELEFKSILDGVEYDEETLPRHRQGKTETTVKILNFFDSHDTDDVLASIISAFSYEKTYYDKITASLLPFLEKLTTLGDLISPDGKSLLPLLTIDDFVNDKLCLLVLLDGLSDPEISKTFGSMFFADMVSGCGKRYKEKEEFDPIYIHPDEFNDVIGDDFIPMLNKAGGAGIVVTAYTQTDQDIELGFGGSSLGSTKALVAKGNFRTIASMRVATEETAEYFGSSALSVDRQIML
ncbi:MAG: conjugative coupling factor TraD (SXT/TOL subfamily) [Francisellaceae bacterium]